ncbi:MAG: hypothetical protein E7383_07970 [Ruminococcaceae bacterium]|nr:hypothetical protein [Oscillospiraceae bacterium]
MSEVVFLSNTNIQIASGSAAGDGVRISKLISSPLPEGAVLNGVVMDQDRLIEAIKLAWQANKLPKSEVTLIINSPQLRANRVDAPILADKKTTEFIERETRDSEYGRFQNPITGWYVVGKDAKAKTQKVVYETSEIDFVNKYVDIFGKAGLKLKTIHNGVQLATEYFTKQAAGKTVLYMILDGKSLVTIFFAEGKYYYDSTSRVFAQPGTPEFAREIYASVSSIRQFISAQHLTETVKDILFCGLAYSHVNQLANDILNLDSTVDISIAQPPQGTSVGSDQSQFPFFVYPIAGLRRIDERMPILKNTKQASKKAKEKSFMANLILPFTLILAAALIAYGVCFAVKMKKQSELDDVEKYINNQSVIDQVTEYDAMYDNMAEMGKIQGGVDILMDDLDSYPVPDSSINKSILEASKKHDVNVDFNSYSASTGVFSITASSPEVEDINQFIADLMAMDIFENVNYTGYSLSSDGKSWQINVVCTLAGREPAAEEVN